ncbi:MAG: alpha/beta family hydrolase [Candidatus Sulfotelmatobacter sp.]
MPVQEFSDLTQDPQVSGFLHTPGAPNNRALALTHGAGGNAQAPLLIALAETFCSAGFTVLRFTLPYRQARSYGPPSPATAGRDRAGIQNAIASLRKQVSDNIYVGGQSYGGRQCSMLCAESPDLVAGLLLLSYPLHPPGKPQQQRTQHLPDLHTPTLFVQGTSDPFATIAELQQAIKMIPAKTNILAVENAGHDLGFRGKSRREELPKQIMQEFLKLQN